MSRVPRIPSRPAHRAQVGMPNPVAVAIARTAVLTQEAQRELLRPGFESLASLRSGRGSLAAWQQLADRLNLAEALCKLRIAGNLAADVHAGHTALSALIERAKAGKGWTLYGPEVKALDDALWVYQTQLKFCSQHEHERAETMVRNRISQAVAGNASARAVVHDAEGIEA